MTELFVALDGLRENQRKALAIAASLQEVQVPFGFKINLDYLLHKGLGPAVRIVQQFERPVFADLKMFNGGRTMAWVAEELVQLGVEYFNLYALADKLIAKAIKATEGTRTKVLGVTVLTHFDDDYCWKHFRRSLPETVGRLAEAAVDAGCHGIILPGTTLGVVADLDIIKAVPGVRPAWYKDNRHEQEVEPRVAKESGANILVCGSPIMAADDAVVALKAVLSEVQ